MTDSAAFHERRPARRAREPCKQVDLDCWSARALRGGDRQTAGAQVRKGAAREYHEHHRPDRRFGHCADREIVGPLETAPFHVDRQFRPALRALAAAVVTSDQFLLAFSEVRAILATHPVTPPASLGHHPLSRADHANSRSFRRSSGRKTIRRTHAIAPRSRAGSWTLRFEGADVETMQDRDARDQNKEKRLILALGKKKPIRREGDDG